MQLLQHFKELTIRPKNTKELKGLIIRLALRGNLTENWRKENLQIRHASELLEDIQDEKALLIEKRKLRPKKVSEIEVTQDMKYAIPKSWAWYNFSEVAFFQEGPGIRKWQYRETGVKLLNVRNVVGHNLVLDNTTLHVEREEFEQKYEHFKVEEGDLLFASSGGSWGKSAWFINPGYDVMLNTSMVRMCFYSKSWYPDYLKTFVSSGFFVDQMSEQLVGIQPNFGSTHLSRIYIPIPPLEEQKEIVKVVETLFKEVEQLEQLTEERIGLKEDFVSSALNQLTTKNANQEWTFLQDHFKSFFNETRNIKKLRETVLQLAVQGKLTADWRANNPETEDASILLKRIQKEKVQLIKEKKIKKEKALPKITREEIPYELPEGWVWCRLNDVCEYIQRGKSPKYTEDPKNPVISQKCVQWTGFDISRARFITEESLEKYGSERFLQKGDLLWNSTGNGTIGRVISYPGSDFKKVVADSHVTVVRAFKEFVSTDYLWIFTASPLIQELVAGRVSGSTNQTELGTGTVKLMEFSFPPLEEQKAIVQKVNALMGLCDSLVQEVKQSQEQIAQLMQSCLREVFEGQKEVS